MRPFIGDIETLAEQNQDFRHVLYTGTHSQLVAMAIPVGEDIGEERHLVDQLFVVVEGLAEVELDGKLYELEDDGLVVVPAGMLHNIVNIGDEELRLLTLYSPPQHAPGTLHRTKAEAALEEPVEVG